MGNAPKRHHFVPQVYLRGWANEHGRVAVRRRDSQETVITGIKNVGLVKGLYGKGLDAVAREQSFSLVESQWPALSEEIRATACQSSKLREQIAAFLTLQRLRTREQRAKEDFVISVSEHILEPFVELADMQRFLVDRWGLMQPTPSEVQAAAAFYNASVSMNGGSKTFDKIMSVDDARHAELASAALLDRHWYVRRAAKPVLVTSDVPVVLWCNRTQTDQLEGIGLQNADEVWFPVDPHHLLVMSKTAGTRGFVDVPVKSLEKASREIASRSFKEVFGGPTQVELLQTLNLAPSKPALRFNTAPSYERSWDGKDIYIGDVLHTWTPPHDGC